MLFGRIVFLMYRGGVSLYTPPHVLETQPYESLWIHIWVILEPMLLSPYVFEHLHIEPQLTDGSVLHKKLRLAFGTFLDLSCMTDTGVVSLISTTV